MNAQSKILAAAVALSVTAPATAGEIEASSIEVVTVTASLREGALLDTAASVTVIDEAAIEESGQQHLQSLSERVPNLNWAGGTSRPRYYQIRGIGERSQYEGAPNPSVGFLVDDIDFSGMGGVATLFDLRQVEVLRGPQGTVHGANALAGLISVHTADPSAEPEFKAQATLGGDGTAGAGVAVGGPLDESLGWRLVAQHYRQDGFRNNAFLGRDDTNGRDEFTGRGKLHWQVRDGLIVKFTGMLVDLDNGYDAWTIDNSLDTLSDQPGKDSQRTAAGAVRVEWDLSDAVSLLSITTAADSEVVFSFDGDWGNDESWGVNGPYDFFSRTDRQRKTASQELRLTSRPGAELFSGSTDWVLGLYALDMDEGNDILETYNGFVYRELTSDYAATNLALFGQLDSRLSERWDLALGLRLEQRRASYHDSQGVRFDPMDTMPGGHLTLGYRVSPRARLYSTLARGYKAGGFNINPSIPADRREFDPEYLWNLEFGMKALSGDGRLRGSAAVFYMDRDDAQVSTSFQDDPTDPLSFTFYNDNAAEGVNYGLESDLEWDFAPGWTLAGALGLLHSEFRDYRVGGRVMDGREQAHAPSWSYSLGVAYRDESGLFARLEVSGKDAFYFSDSHDQRSAAYRLLNARVGYEAGQWTVALWARNLLDERYAVRGFFFANEPPDWQEKLYTRQGDPRHVGLTLSYRY